MRRSVVKVAAVLMLLIMIKCVDGVSGDEEMATFRGVRFDADVRKQFPECRKCWVVPCSKMELEAKKIEPKTCWTRNNDITEIYFFDSLPLGSGYVHEESGKLARLGFSFPSSAFDRLGELVESKFGKPASTSQLKVWRSKGLSIELHRYELPGIDTGLLIVQTQAYGDKTMREYEERRKNEEKVL